MARYQEMSPMYQQATPLTGPAVQLRSARSMERLPAPEAAGAHDDVYADYEEDASDEPPCAVCCFFTFGFIAMWLGPGKLDQDDDGDFDLQDAKRLWWAFRNGKLGETVAVKKTMRDTDGDGIPDGMEDDYAAHMNKFPAFIVAQTLIAGLLWLIGMMQSCYFSSDRATTCPDGASQTTAGLITWFPDSVLQFHDYDCNSYRDQIWRLLTYQFSHNGLSHLGMNMFLNLIIGLPLGLFNGWKRMLCMWEMGVLGGAFFVALFDVHSTVIGMSGGCYALIGIKCADLFINWSEKHFRRAELGFLVFLMLADFLYGAFFTQSNMPLSSATCHMGGLLAGWVGGLLLDRNLNATKLEKAVQLVSATLYAVFLVAGFIWLYTAWPPRNFWGQAPWCWLRQTADYQLFGDGEHHCVYCYTQGCMDLWSARGATLFPADTKECFHKVGLAAYREP